MPSSLLQRLASRNAILPSMGVLTAAIALVAWIAPSDKTLGDMVKMVYVHGAVIRITLLTFVLSGALGIAYLPTGRAAWHDWSQALARTGLALWIVYVVVSAIATIQTWGGIPAFEPRWIFTFQVLVIAPIFHLVGAWLKNPRIAALLNAALGALILYLLSQARLIMHPIDPIGQATTDSVRVAYAILLMLCGLFAAQLARGIRQLAASR